MSYHRPLTDEQLLEREAEFGRAEVDAYLAHYRALTANVLRGELLAWAVAHVPGTTLALVGSTLTAFVRDTGHGDYRAREGRSAAAPAERVARYVEAGVASLGQAMQVAA